MKKKFLFDLKNVFFWGVHKNKREERIKERGMKER